MVVVVNDFELIDLAEPPQAASARARTSTASAAGNCFPARLRFPVRPDGHRTPTQPWYPLPPRPPFSLVISERIRRPR
jgi:hypothetical protein